MASCLSINSKARSSLLLGLTLGLSIVSCKREVPSSNPPQQATSSSAAALTSVAASASPKPPRVPRPKGTVPKAETIALTSRDGMKLSAWLYTGGDENAPAVIFAHRMGGSNEEWGPLLERLFPVNQKMNLLVLDMRGHGESVKKQGDTRKIAWTSFEQKEFVAMSKDVEAAAAWLNKRPGGAPSTMILVGSDIGATACVLAAPFLGKHLAGVGLVSPGASLRGVDLYKPFSVVAGLPNLVVGGLKDNISEEPLRALPAMSKTTQSRIYDSSMHSAEHLGTEKPESWDEIADWIDARAKAEVPAAAASSASVSAPKASAQ